MQTNGRVHWLKNEGDPVEQYEIIMEVCPTMLLPLLPPPPVAL